MAGSLILGFSQKPVTVINTNQRFFVFIVISDFAPILVMGCSTLALPLLIPLSCRSHEMLYTKSTSPGIEQA